MTTPLQGVPWTGAGVDDLTAQVRVDRTELGPPGIIDDSALAIVSTTAAETTLLTSAPVIPASTLAVGDVVEVFTGAGCVNAKGSSGTITLNLKMNSTTVFSSGALTVNNGVADWRCFIRTLFVCVATGGAGTASFQFLGMFTPAGAAGGSSIGTQAFVAGSTTAVPTNADITIDWTGTLSASSASFIMTGAWCSVSRQRRLTP